MNDSATFDQDRARHYDDRIQRHVVGYAILHELADTLLTSLTPEKASILVAGVGTGMEIATWAPRHPGWRFVGTDPSQAMIDLAQEKLKHLSDRVTLKVGDVADLPTDLFDGAALILALHFVPDHGQKEALLQAIAERLTPGAPFLLVTMFGEPDSTRYKRIISLTKSWALDHGMDSEHADKVCDPSRRDLHIVPEERIKNLLRDAGFIDIQRVYQALSVGAWFARNSRTSVD